MIKFIKLIYNFPVVVLAVFLLVFFTLYTAVNYYIFIRGWQALAVFPQLKIFYLIAFLIISLSYILAKVLSSYLPLIIYDLMLWLGSFWFAFMIYFFISIVFLDLLRLSNHFFNIFPISVKENYQNIKFYTLVIVLILTSLIVLFGFLNAKNIKGTTLNIDLPKKESKLNNLNAVMISDIHLSPINNEKFLSKIIDKINQLNPDIILMAGDIVDDKAEILNERGIGKAFLKLNPKYGVFSSTGNHEFISGVDGAVKFMRDFNLNIVRDSIMIIENSIAIIGRDDRSKDNFTRKKRKSLKEIINDETINLPTILLDHTPVNLDEAKNNNIDLQLSGHTHHGQLFPINIITNMIYEVSWGYLKKEKTQYYVSCGVGTWGPPVRLGSNAEIVNLKINFVD